MLSKIVRLLVNRELYFSNGGVYGYRQAMADQPSGGTAATAPAAATGGSQSLCSLGLSANQPAVLFSHTKSAPATSYRPISSTVIS